MDAPSLVSNTPMIIDVDNNNNRDLKRKHEEIAPENKNARLKPFAYTISDHDDQNVKEIDYELFFNAIVGILRDKCGIDLEKFISPTMVGGAQSAGKTRFITVLLSMMTRTDCSHLAPVSEGTTTRQIMHIFCVADPSMPSPFELTIRNSENGLRETKKLFSAMEVHREITACAERVKRSQQETSLREEDSINLCIETDDLSFVITDTPGPIFTRSDDDHYEDLYADISSPAMVLLTRSTSNNGEIGATSGLASCIKIIQRKQCSKQWSNVRLFLVVTHMDAVLKDTNNIMLSRIISDIEIIKERIKVPLTVCFTSLAKPIDQPDTPEEIMRQEQILLEKLPVLQIYADRYSSGNFRIVLGIKNIQKALTEEMRKNLFSNRQILQDAIKHLDEMITEINLRFSVMHEHKSLSSVMYSLRSIFETSELASETKKIVSGLLHSTLRSICENHYRNAEWPKELMDKSVVDDTNGPQMAHKPLAHTIAAQRRLCEEAIKQLLLTLQECTNIELLQNTMLKVLAEELAIHCDKWRNFSGVIDEIKKVYNEFRKQDLKTFIQNTQRTISRRKHFIEVFPTKDVDRSWPVGSLFISHAALQHRNSRGDNNLVRSVLEIFTTLLNIIEIDLVIDFMEFRNSFIEYATEKLGSRREPITMVYGETIESLLETRFFYEKARNHANIILSRLPAQEMDNKNSQQVTTTTNTVTTTITSVVAANAANIASIATIAGAVGVPGAAGVASIANVIDLSVKDDKDDAQNEDGTQNDHLNNEKTYGVLRRLARFVTRQ